MRMTTVTHIVHIRTYCHVFYFTQKLGCRGESRLYQPNEVHNSADTVVRDKMDRVELSRRIYQTPDVYPVTEYPGDTQLMHRENRPLHTI